MLTRRRTSTTLSCARLEKRTGRFNDIVHAGDAFGHEAGDIALKNAVLALFANFRQADLIIRWGGEEFLILLFIFCCAAGKACYANERCIVKPALSCPAG